MPGSESDRLGWSASLDIGEFSQQHLVDDLNPVARLSDVLTYIIYIIKEVAESVQQEIGLTQVFCHLRIGHDIDAMMLDVDVDILARHDGVAIVVDGSGLLAMDM